jgi:hypothetical protein
MGRHRVSVKLRLKKYRYVNPKTGCWEWTRSRSKKGYGQIWIVDKFFRVSRVAHEIYIGPIPEGLNVLHSCDNPPCFNPKHLFAGTQGDNVRDSVKKGRWGSKPKKRCKRGHKRTRRGPCPKCYKIYHRAYYLRNRKRLLAYARKRDRRKVKT